MIAYDVVRHASWAAIDDGLPNVDVPALNSMHPNVPLTWSYNSRNISTRPHAIYIYVMYIYVHAYVVELCRLYNVLLVAVICKMRDTHLRF